MADRDTDRLIDMLYERIEEAKSPALKPGMSIVDREEMFDLLDELRAQLPVEIKRAQELLAARKKLSSHMSLYRKGILKGNPSASSKRFGEALKELRDMLNIK